MLDIRREYKHNFLISLISSENITTIHLLLYIVQHTVVAVGNDGLTLFLESLQVVHCQATEEYTAVRGRRLVDDDRIPLRLDALHHPLDRNMAEIVTAGLHGETVNANCSEF